jgi:hypothetical protein
VRKLFALVVLVALAAGAYRAYPRVHAWWVARSVPADLRGYVGGGGVQYAAPGQGYSVRLPKTPVQRDVPPSAQPAPWSVIHRAVVTGSHYHIVIRVGVLAGGATLPFGLGGTLADARFGGTPAPRHLRPVTFRDVPAFTFRVDGAHPVAGEVFQRGARVYVVSVQAKGAGSVLDTVLGSFTPVA